VQDEESPKQQAIRLLKRQLEVLRTNIRGLNDNHPDFKAWRDTTRGILERFLGPESHHTKRFRDTRFYGPSYVQSDYPGTRRIPDSVISQEQSEAFQKGCETPTHRSRPQSMKSQNSGSMPGKPSPPQLGEAGAGVGA
jgi:hypothetical protein